MASKWQRCLSCSKQLLYVNRFTSVSVSAPVYYALHTDLGCKDRGFSTTCDISSSEALRALRPFYLAVHPDLFPQHPRERTTNEDSLKKLNSYLDALVVVSGCGQGGSTMAPVARQAVRPKPIQLTFFIKARQSENLKPVSVSLDAYSIGSAVHDILQSCDLFADISNPAISKLLQTKHQESEKHRVLSTYNRYKSHHHHHHDHHSQEPLQDYPDFDYIFSERKFNKTSSVEHAYVRHSQPECLRNWLKQNLSLARSRLDSSRRLREENESLKEKICLRYGLLRSIEVNPEWTAATVKGHLLSLERALGVVANGSSLDALVEELGGGDRDNGDGGGLRIMLGHSGSFVSIHGHVHLSYEETVQQWLQFLLNHTARELAIVREIDSLEKELLGMMNHNSLGGDSSCCDDIRPILIKRPSTLTPSEYHLQLKDCVSLYSRQLPPCNLQIATDDSNNYSKKMTFDHHSSRNTDGIIITIVTKSQAGLGLGEPFLLEDGTVEVPVKCPLNALRDFCLKNLHRIRETRRKHERSVDEMLQAIQTCKQELLLNDLRVKANNNIKNDHIKSSCQKLLQLARVCDHGSQADERSPKELDLSGHYLTLTNSYSVSSDGELRIPWDFKIT